MTTKEKLERDHKISRKNEKPKKNLGATIELFIDRCALIGAFLTVLFTSAVGFRSLLKNLPEWAGYGLTVVSVLALTYIIFKNRKSI